jgi:hypothetical protein
MTSYFHGFCDEGSKVLVLNILGRGENVENQHDGRHSKMKLSHFLQGVETVMFNNAWYVNFSILGMVFLILLNEAIDLAG